MFDNDVLPKKIIILSDIKLSMLKNLNVLHKLDENNFEKEYWYIDFDFSKRYPHHIFTIEPNKNKHFDTFKQEEKIKYILFNGLGKFKGLEKEIVLLIVKNPEKETGNESLLRNIYIGASRSKFGLFVCYYDDI